MCWGRNAVLRSRFRRSPGTEVPARGGLLANADRTSLDGQRHLAAHLACECPPDSGAQRAWTCLVPVPSSTLPGHRRGHFSARV